MDSSISLPTHHLLFQVARDVKANSPSVSATVEVQSSWHNALQASMDSLQPDYNMPVFRQRTKDERNALKRLAISNTDESVSQCQGTKPIQTFPTQSQSTKPTQHLSPRALSARRERLRKLAKENIPSLNREPYIIQSPVGCTEGPIPTVSGTLVLSGMDADPNDYSKQFSITVDKMIWDTSCHISCITSDLLPASFTRYLETDIENKSYFDGATGIVQVNGEIIFTNTSFQFNTIFRVVPPNRRSGVILGQSALMDRMVTTNIPRTILEKRGENIEEGLWGRIHLVQFVDIYDELHIL